MSSSQGNLEYFQRFVALSEVLAFDDGQTLVFQRPGIDHFVFGGDAFDKGDGDIRISHLLTDFKDRHPEHVHLIIGNRDANKMRMAAELDDAEVAHPGSEVAFEDFWTPHLEGIPAVSLVEVTASREHFPTDHATYPLPCCTGSISAS